MYARKQLKNHFASVYYEIITDQTSQRA